MGDFLSLGSLNFSNIASHKGTWRTKVACGHVHTEKKGMGQSMLSVFYLYFISVKQGLFKNRILSKHILKNKILCH